MANPSLIFTITILIVIMILFLISAFTGWLVTNPYLLPLLLTLTAWGFALWLVISYYTEWTPYKSTKSNSSNNIESNKNYNKTVFIYSAVFFIITTILFIILLILVIMHKPHRVSNKYTRIRQPIVLEQKDDSTNRSTPPSSDAELPSTNAKNIDSGLGYHYYIQQSHSARLDKLERLVERLVEELKFEQSLKVTGTKVTPDIESDIMKKRQELSSYIATESITPKEEAVATRVAEDKIRKGQESLTKVSPSSYFTRKEMFGYDGESTRLYL